MLFPLILPFSVHNHHPKGILPDHHFEAALPQNQPHHLPLLVTSFGALLPGKNALLRLPSLALGKEAFSVRRTVPGTRKAFSTYVGWEGMGEGEGMKKGQRSQERERKKKQERNMLWKKRDPRDITSAESLPTC